MEYQPASYGVYIYPIWADAIGWIIGLLPVSIIIISGIVQLTQAPGNLSFTQKLKLLIKPTAEWDLCSRTEGGHQKGHRNSRCAITKTTVLINGVPISDAASSEDAMQLCECPSASKLSQKSDDGATSDDVIFIFDDSLIFFLLLNSKSKQLFQFNEINVLINTKIDNKQPGPSILKTAKNGKNSTNGKSKTKIPDCSPSKQPLISSPSSNKSDTVHNRAKPYPKKM